jgi:chemotaxis protein MotB
MSDDNRSADESGYWISLSDLLAGMLIIFILTLCYAVLDYAEDRDKLQEVQKKLSESLELRSQILQAIADSLHSRDSEIVIAVDTVRGAILLPEGVLFGSGQARLSSRGIQTLEVLGPVIYDILIQEQFTGQVETIFVEGHTDDRPISTKLQRIFASNWELSSQRAINAWRALRSSAKLDSLRNHSGQQLFSCSGYADSRPVLEGDSPEVRRRNRRIDLRFHMIPPSTNWDPTITEALTE